MAQIRVIATDTATKRQYRRRNTKEVSRPKFSIAKLDKPSKLVELHPGEFSMDLKVQREVNELRTRQMAQNFQPQSLGLITASKRADGHIYALDGAHRISAARLAKYDGLLATRLFEGLTLEEEAGLFLSLNTTRAVQAIDRFKVRITMGDPSAVAINKVLKRYDLAVDWASNETRNIISAVSTLEKVYAGAGVRPEGEYPDLVDKVLSTIRRAYGDNTERTTFNRPMLEGLGILWATFGNRIDRERLNAVLQETVPRQVTALSRTLRDAKGGTLGECAAETLHRLYNHRHRAKLPEFSDVDARDLYFMEDPTQDPLYVDPAQFVQEQEPAMA